MNKLVKTVAVLSFIGLPAMADYNGFHFSACEKAAMEVASSKVSSLGFSDLEISAVEQVGSVVEVTFANADQVIRIAKVPVKGDEKSCQASAKISWFSWSPENGYARIGSSK